MENFQKKEGKWNYYTTHPPSGRGGGLGGILGPVIEPTEDTAFPGKSASPVA